jgi:hypothetical protein
LNDHGTDQIGGLTCKYICKYMHTYFLISPCTINHDPSFYINFILHSLTCRFLKDDERLHILLYSFIFTLVFWISTNTYKRFMKTKFKQWWSTIPTISTKRTVNSHFKPCKYMHTYFLISPCTINHDPSFYINFILHSLRRFKST